MNSVTYGRRVGLDWLHGYRVVWGLKVGNSGCISFLFFVIYGVHLPFKRTVTPKVSTWHVLRRVVNKSTAMCM